jgi:CHAD domain-containing protein
MKWIVKGPGKQTAFIDAGKMILMKRLKSLIQTIRKYFRDESIENLHRIRIALRRLRYTLEVFYCCLDRKTFMPFYKNIEHLQDITGEVRDLDVLRENTLMISDNKMKVDDFLEKLDMKRQELSENVRLELMKFIHNKETKEFKNQLKREE